MTRNNVHAEDPGMIRNVVYSGVPEVLQMILDLQDDGWLPIVNTHWIQEWYVPLKYVVHSGVPKVLQTIVDLQDDTWLKHAVDVRIGTRLHPAQPVITVHRCSLCTMGACHDCQFPSCCNLFSSNKHCYVTPKSPCSSPRNHRWLIHSSMSYVENT